MRKRVPTLKQDIRVFFGPPCSCLIVIIVDMLGGGVFVLLALLCLSSIVSAQIQCAHYDSQMGATFDLTELIRRSDELNYIVEDGDIPCTPEVSYFLSINIYARIYTRFC